ncbi:ydcI [Symbiodinium necroappetens]|uniref:YdcI protein n=1 Tax=Symbiodinium necroappetens TaxID=1628268 RepID=A0A812IY04_9DINO|nr:ydcI [Symbiodinium necroappetens]
MDGLGWNSSEDGSPNLADAQKVLGDQSQIRKDEAGWIAAQLGLEKGHVAGAVRLFQEGSTLPFIARYRKEQTGSMNEENLRRVERELNRVRDLETKRARVALALQRGKHLTPDLGESLLQAESLEDIDALWAPFKAKRQTRAQVAKSLGLEPLASLLEEAAKQLAPRNIEVALPLEAEAVTLQEAGPEKSEEAEKPREVEFLKPQAPLPEKTLEEAAAQFITAEVPNVEAVLKAARDILAEQFAHRGDVRQLARSVLENKVRLASRRRGDADPEGQFKTYWEFSSPLRQVKPHQFLAVQRGEQKKCLSLSFAITAEDSTYLLDALMATFLGDRPRQGIEATPTPMRAAGGKSNLGGRAAYRAEIRLALEDAYKRLLLPFLEREWRRRLKQQAEDEAFDTYRRNLKKKLLLAPLRLHPDWGYTEDCGSPVSAVLGVDPAFRTGCKCALISLTGQVLATKTVFPHPNYAGASVPLPQAETASRNLKDLLQQGLGFSEAPDLDALADLDPPSSERPRKRCRR